MKALSVESVKEVIRLAEVRSSRELPRGGAMADMAILDDDPSELALSTRISAFSKEELSELCALMWLGRGDGGESVGDWEDLVADAAGRDSAVLADYIGEKWPLNEYLRDGLVKLGLSS
jgi:hypothetical protein